ncbi:A disintegrin and metalloproteinase with thrombospondin motifs 7-like [Schistocerca nitens]|uniref:A disintegrin and metalloproteinase with thrombospondin motifs 7-like n=1 Tax=Schistocerca nitens TaxID=7011 RepID=UPI00211881CA|nr:A disintegrin and metalloproteinase with thrombospondin motifs 7-like [Schistocerca nitens]
MPSRHTREPADFELVVPLLVHADGSFRSFRLAQFYERPVGGSTGAGAARHHRSPDPGPEEVHVRVPWRGAALHVELQPSVGLASPALVVERRRGPVPNASQLRAAGRRQCHYTGRVRGMAGSRAALSLCDGLDGVVPAGSRPGAVAAAASGGRPRLPEARRAPRPAPRPVLAVRAAAHAGRPRLSALLTSLPPAGYVRAGDLQLLVQPARGHRTRVAGGGQLHVVSRRQLDAHQLRPRRTCATSGQEHFSQNDWRAAWAERLRWQSQQEGWSGRNASARSVSQPRYLETLVVADKKFLDYHKGSDLENYILTIMNMVADFYHDGSVGNLLNVVVVRIIYLEKEEEEMDLEISPDAEKTLASFCKWQVGVNPKDISHPNHHDIAVLLTRHDICSDNMSNCNLMGLAYVAAACKPDLCCAINEDSGLLLGVTVAHEMGHVMGCSHDEENVSGCPPKVDDNNYNVMSPYVMATTTQWSPCSRKFITTFLDAGLGECLLDEPQESRYAYPEMPPGAMYDADYQCKTKFGSPGVCAISPESHCKRLMCKKGNSSCVSDGSPAADGTKCGENKWCYGQQCVPAGERPRAVAGGWGEWGEWQSCSRTCGGGVQASQRECDNPPPAHRGRYCVGLRRRYRVCNIQPCEDGSPTFREVQCSEMDSKPFEDKLHKWKPYRKVANPCALVCINEERVYSTLAPRVKDGTPCKPGTRDMCIAGRCRHVGCDWVLDSDAADDPCGVCKGNGTMCQKVDHTFTQASGNGYTKVVTVPTGSRHLSVEELGPTENTIAVSDEKGEIFFLNGNYTEEADGEYRMGGVLAFYSHPQPNQERLDVPGPTQQPLTIHVVFFGGKNPGVHYSYYEPLERPAERTPRYSWEFLGWQDCNVVCGGGTQVAEPVCVEEGAGRVSDQSCTAEDKPAPRSRVCNEQSCKIRWRAATWGRCSGCVFRVGMARRRVECVRQAARPEDDPAVVPEASCKGLPRPAGVKFCKSTRPCSKAAPAPSPHGRSSKQVTGAASARPSPFCKLHLPIRVTVREMMLQL